MINTQKIDDLLFSTNTVYIQKYMNLQVILNNFN